MKNKIFYIYLFLLSFLINSAGFSYQQNNYDIIVVGAGTGGVASAIQASRMGANVLLLEETDWVGGQATSSGVTSMDGNYSMRYGIYKEFTDRIIQHYQSIGKQSSGCYWSSFTICFEPFVGKNILLNMISNENNLTLKLNTSVLSVDKDSSNKIVGINTSEGYFFTNILVDATEYGDIILLSGANYRIGNQTNETYQTPACIQDITYTAIIKEYASGIPSDLQINIEPPFYTEEVKEYFRYFLSNSGSPIWNGTFPVNFENHNKYRLIPNSYSSISKTSVNWFNDFPSSSGLGENLSTQYLYDKTYRNDINCQAKLRTIQFIYYVQNELGKNWSVSKDEGYETPYNISHSCEMIPNEFKEIEYNMPIIPYVRESIRGVGGETVSGYDIFRAGRPAYARTRYQNSISLGDYPNDLHGCNTSSTLESMETIQDISSNAGVFQIPSGVLFSNNVDGLIFAEKNISVTRITNGSTRLQPITMMIGQASGTMAYFAHENSISPSQVNPLDIQKKLLDDGFTLFPYSDMNQSSQYFKDMQMMSARGIMNGYNILTYGTNDNLTRGQMAVVLSKSFSIQPVVPTGIFTDVSVSDMCAPYI